MSKPSTTMNLGTPPQSNLKKIEVILVDFNDTLSPSNFQYCFEGFREQTGWSGKELVDAYVQSGLLTSLMKGKITERVFWSKVSELTKIDVKNLLEVSSKIKETKILNEELLRILQAIKTNRKYKLYLMTDNVQETFDYWIEKFRLHELFEGIFNSAVHGMTKRDPEFYLFVLDKIDAVPQKTLLIDDEAPYIQIAKNVGIQTIQYVSVTTLRHDLAKYSIRV